MIMQYPGGVKPITPARCAGDESQKPMHLLHGLFQCAPGTGALLRVQVPP